MTDVQQNLIGIRASDCFWDILAGKVKLEQVECIFIPCWEEYRVIMDNPDSRVDYVCAVIRNSFRYESPKCPEGEVDAFLSRSDAIIREIALKLVSPDEDNKWCDPWRVKGNAVIDESGSPRTSLGHWVDSAKNEKILWRLNIGG